MSILTPAEEYAEFEKLLINEFDFVKGEYNYRWEYTTFIKPFGFLCFGPCDTSRGKVLFKGVGLYFLYINDEYHHKGYATMMMEWACFIADSVGCYLYLSSKGFKLRDSDEPTHQRHKILQRTRDGCMNDKQLEKWYEQYWFESQGKDLGMERRPNPRDLMPPPSFKDPLELSMPNWWGNNLQANNRAI